MLRKIGIVIGLIILFAALTITLYMMHPIFGRRPEGKRLELIKKSPNFRDGKFQNIHHTPQLTEGYGYTKALYEYLFKKSKHLKPIAGIPSSQPDWAHLNPKEDMLIWLGHSSYFMQIDGKRILVDPVLSGSASPIPGGGKSFRGTDVATADELPTIDFLFISHDHYDHMDYETLKKLKDKVGKVICGLGVGQHLEEWGYPESKIIEKDWNEEVDLGDGFMVHTTTARHFSGRSIYTANTLWMAYVLQTPTLKIYIGGDSGYDTHFAEIGEKYGPFDLAILENGQYDLAWKYIHMQPEEVLQAAKDLKAKVLFPVHSSKFVLANHAWYEPLERISNLADTDAMPLLTPLIGEKVDLKNKRPILKRWWKNVP